jgi:hypothetical protein
MLTRAIITAVLLLASCSSPKWKTDRATEIRREILSFLGARPKAIYIRDFNQDDRVFEAYIERQDGNPEVLGCAFNPSEPPHCALHELGTVSIESVRAEIMAKPFRLIPE